MDNDDAMIGRILTRREALSLVARAGAGLAVGGALWTDADAALQAKAQREVKLVATPALTEGPFFVDEKLNRSNILGDTKRQTVVGATPLALEITIYKLTNGKYSLLKGAMVDVWHCDAIGVYSGEDHPMNHEDTAGQNWLRGHQITGADGIVRFETIYPGWYPGRTPHIHFKVRHAGTDFTSQLFFDDAVSDKVFVKAPYKGRTARGPNNGSDGIYRERQVDGTVAGDLLKLELSASGKGFLGKFAVALSR